MLISPPASWCWWHLRSGKSEQLIFHFYPATASKSFSYLWVGINYTWCAGLVVHKILTNSVILYFRHFYKISIFFSWTINSSKSTRTLGGIRTNFVEQVIGKICFHLARILRNLQDPIRRVFQLLSSIFYQLLVNEIPWYEFLYIKFFK